MTSRPERSLKSLNVKWLVALAAADLVAVALFAAPHVFTADGLMQFGIGRGIATTVLPVLVLLIVNVLPANAKALLVYWNKALPGSRCFTKYGPSDPRTDMAALKRNVGELPTDPKEQNAKWYKLYMSVQNETEVSAAHKDFLMYRDMAVISLPWILLAPPGLKILGASLASICACGGLFFAQYLLAALSARHAGIRFVCNVLAIHSARKVIGLR